MNRTQIVELLKNNDRAIARALVVLNQRQTTSEQATEATRYRNGEGFRPCHARMGTSMANFFTRRGYLSPKQIAYWRAPMKCGKMRIEIYANQLLEIAQAKAAAKKDKPAAQVAYVDADYGNLMEERMVLQEQLDSAEGATVSDIKGRLEQIDLMVRAIKAESEMQRIESDSDQAQSRLDELNKFVARCQMESRVKV